MSQHKQKLGKKGEDIACEYLLDEKYEILEKNWRSSNQEIDIIATKENILVFIEVKTRSNTKFGHPEEAVNKLKQQQIFKAAESFIKIYRGKFSELRFDVISILLDYKHKKLKHFEDAFYPMQS